MTTPAFTIEIKAPELTAALTAIAAALGGYAKVTGTSAIPVEQTETAEAEKPKRAPRAAKASEPETTVEPSKEPTSSSDEQTSSTDKDDAGSASLSYDTDVRPKVLALVAKRGRDAATELLSQFAREDLEAVTNGKELLEADWAEFIQKADALIEGEVA